MEFSMRVRSFVLVLFLGCLVFAQPTNAKQKSASQTQVNKKQAAMAVQKKYRGRIMSVKEHAKVYKVRVMQAKGKVVDVEVNKRSGKIKKGKNNANSNY